MPTKSFIASRKDMYRLSFLKLVSNLTPCSRLIVKALKANWTDITDRNSAILSENIILFLIFSWFYCSFNGSSVIRHFSNVNTLEIWMIRSCEFCNLGKVARSKNKSCTMELGLFVILLTYDWIHFHKNSNYFPFERKSYF